MADSKQHWVVNKDQKRIYNSATPSLCLSSFGMADKLNMRDCKEADKWEKAVGYKAIRSVRYQTGTTWKDDPTGSRITIFNW